jgi:D-sedoheptulose 7-phosphate isomerase
VHDIGKLAERGNAVDFFLGIHHFTDTIALFTRLNTPVAWRPAVHSHAFLQRVAQIAESLDVETIERMALGLAELRERGGRLFLLGVGGSAANCSHAVNDFRKLAGIEAYAPTDNVSELTARTNDEGWETVFSSWLQVSKANEDDAVLVMSVGGGDAARKVSANLVVALQEAKERGLRIYGIVGRDGGYTKEVGDEVVVVPTVDPQWITPLAEAFQGVVWHALVSHPALKTRGCKWESVAPGRVA